MSAIEAISIDMPSGASSCAARSAAVLYEPARRLPDKAMILRGEDAMIVVYFPAGSTVLSMGLPSVPRVRVWPVAVIGLRLFSVQT